MEREMTNFAMYNRSTPKEAAPLARFWETLNGAPVKLTIKAGAYIDHEEYHSTEEGYEMLETILTFDGFELLRRTTRRARDCDGSLTHTSRETAVELYRDAAGNMVPNWVRA